MTDTTLGWLLNNPGMKLSLAENNNTCVRYDKKMTIKDAINRSIAKRSRASFFFVFLFFLLVSHLSLDQCKDDPDEG